MPVPPAVEEETGRDHEELPGARVRVEKPIGREDHGEEDGEVGRREQHLTSAHQSTMAGHHRPVTGDGTAEIDGFYGPVRGSVSP